eukprot:353304-Chlamydomonas_euryale.AAC.3
MHQTQVLGCPPSPTPSLSRVQAWPAIQVTTQRHDWLLCQIQAYIAPAPRHAGVPVRRSYAL